MNLAEATSALSKKEGEKTAVLEEIEKLRDLRDNGDIAILHATVLGLAPALTDADVKLSYELFDDNFFEPSAAALDQSLHDAVQLNMPSKTGTLSIIVVIAAKFTEEFDADAKPAKYRADFSVAEIPEDGELRTDVPAGRILEEGETVEEEEMIVNLKLKVSVDDVSALLASKHLVLTQLESEFMEIVAAVQEAKSRQAAKPTKTKEPSTKKTKKSTRVSPSASGRGSASTDTDAADDTPVGPSYVDMAMTGAMAGGAFLLQNYAYIAFGVAAVTIHLYGDYASL